MSLLVTKEEDFYLSTLMAHSQDGDAASYDLLLVRTSFILRKFLRSKIDEPHGLDEVIQESLISIHEYRNTYSIERSFAGWAFAIAQNRMIDHFRKFRRIQGRELQMEPVSLDLKSELDSSYEMPTQQTEIQEKIHELMNCLSDDQKEIVRLLKLDGLTIRETSKKMNMSESAVKVAAHRAYIKLKERFGHGHA